MLLIVPYGIEIISAQRRKTAITSLLIVPYGIEILIDRNTTINGIGF